MAEQHGKLQVNLTTRELKANITAMQDFLKLHERCGFVMEEFDGEYIPDLESGLKKMEELYG